MENRITGRILAWTAVLAAWVHCAVGARCAEPERLPLELGELVWEAPAAPSRQLEALGERGGMWGTVDAGLEAWAYPFKLFDGLRISVTDLAAGAREDLWNAARLQRATPHLAQWECEGRGWRMVATCFYPRSLEGGVLLLQLEAERALELGVTFRPSLTPMLMDGSELSRSEWDSAGKSLVLREASRAAELRVSSPFAVGVGETRGGEQVLRVRPSADRAGRLTVPVYFAAGWSRGPVAKEVLERLENRLPILLRAARQHYSKLLSAAPRVESPDPRVNDALAWSVVSLDQFRVQNPFLGYGWVSGYSGSKGTTRPRYCWFFEDPTLTSWAFLRLGLNAPVKESLRFLQRYQREDGKTVHEVTQSLRYRPDFLDTYRYAYMHSDGPVYYLLAYGQYFRATGDLEFIREEWPRIRRTLDWCFAAMDPADSLLVIAKGDWGSAESSTGVLKDTQLEGIWVRALEDMSRLARELGENELADRCRATRAAALASVEAKLWDEAAGNYVWGLGRGGERLGSTVPHHAISFWLSAFRRDRVARALQRFASADFRTDWGVRSLSVGDSNYDPAGYQTGAVWPVWNAGVIVSDYRHGRAGEAFRNWLAMVNMRRLAGLGPMPEVFHGATFEPLEECVPHQMFSELAVVNGFFDGLLGLDVDAPKREVSLAPSLPPAWSSLKIERIPIGADRMSLDFRWDLDRVACVLDVTGPGVQVRLAPRLPAGATVHWVKVDGEKVSFETEGDAIGTSVTVELGRTAGRREVEIRHTGGVDCVPVDEALERGAESGGLRMIGMELEERLFRMTVEGKPGVDYGLQIHTRRVPRRVLDGRMSRATVEGFRVETHAPEHSVTNAAGYARWVTTVQF